MFLLNLGSRLLVIDDRGCVSQKINLRYSRETVSSCSGSGSGSNSGSGFCFWFDLGLGINYVA